MTPSKRLVLAAGFGAAAFFLAGVAGAVFAHKKVEEEKAAIQGLRGEIGSAQEKVAAIPKREREVVVARENMAEASRILPDTKEIHDFVRSLREFQDDSGVRISSLEDRTPRRPEGRGFERVGYGMQLDGNLWQLLTFLSRLESYERFVRVPRLQVAAGPRPENGDYENVRHTVRLELETFVHQAGKDAAKPVEIPHYERKRDAMREEIAKAREGILEVPVYEFRGDRGRRDPLLDPRLPVAQASGLGLPLDQQAALLDRLRAAVGEFEAAMQAFSGLQDVLARAERRRMLEKAIQSLGEEIAAVEREGRVSYLPLARRFRREVLEPFSAARTSFLALVEAGPSAAELRSVIEGMRGALASGDLGNALDRLALVSDRLRTAEQDPARAPLVFEVRRLERQIRLAEEFSRKSLDIQGVIVRPDAAVAILNGRTVSEGDFLDEDLLVRRIREDEVEFLFRDLVIAKKR